MNLRAFVFLVVILIANTASILFPLSSVAAGMGYKNPMRMNLELLDDKSDHMSKNAVVPHDYYASEERRKWAESHKDYGRFLYQAGKYDDAIQALKKSLEMDPKLSLAHYFLGLTYWATKDYVRANHHAQIVYSRGFPLSELREKLM